MNCYQTNAIILERKNVFEADRLYLLYSEDFGKITAIAGSVRKINAKLSGHLEPFTLAWVELIAKRSGDLFITTALSYDKFLNGNALPSRVALCAKMADFISKMLRGPQKDRAMWDFILGNFINAKNIEPEKTEIFLNDFKSGFVKIMGFGESFEEARFYLGDFGV